MLIQKLKKSYWWRPALSLSLISLSFTAYHQALVDADLVRLQKDGSLQYKADAKGNTLPDFSNVGYHSGEKEWPNVQVVKTISPAAEGSSEQIIQDAINEVSARAPDANGYRGAVLLKKGKYLVPGTIRITTGGIVIRGEGNTANGTCIVATGKGQRTLLQVSGDGRLQEIAGSRTDITDAFVPVGAHSFNVKAAGLFKPGDKVVIYRPGTQTWISDLQMDRIDAREGTLQWQPKEFNLEFERTITAVNGNKVVVDAPVVMQMEAKYGGGQLFKYNFAGRIAEVGIEDIYFESEYAGDNDEDHGWRAVAFSKAENCWVNHVTSRYFGYSCVDINNSSKNITVTNSKCLDAKSQITGGRRYSFVIDGQLNLVTNCETTEGRHDYVTGARVCGPNVFYHCKARRTHADIGPHQRWAAGTLYDNIDTDGEINVQDRGNYGTGHGWSGVTQVLWNCKVQSAAVQNPWVSGTNYAIGVAGKQAPGRFANRNQAVWESKDQPVNPPSLYEAQLKARLLKK
ncbi:DUF4955 domain-containing protein [Mucilaginibacter sp. PAMB04168]|uniref:DUF4955 domain-containing protein n=1 Tax=Mucilaginibacter sp. PAMB04168 TaxID=3138567 RepID=UPI0031F622B0